MKSSEILHIIGAIIILGLVLGFAGLLSLNQTAILLAFVYALVLIGISVVAKKVMASMLDADVEHSIWYWRRYWFKKGQYLNKKIPAGVLVPVLISIISLGKITWMALLTYETTPLKRRAAKRHGYYSFTEITDWHHAVIGGAGIVAILLLSLITYWIPGLETLARFAAFYAFFNMLPIFTLDGAHIFFGSRPLWYTLAIITLVFTVYALVLI